jgi:Mn-dependent DtxR family transcriptional regulator
MQEQKKKKKSMKGRTEGVKSMFSFIKGEFTKDLAQRICVRSPRVTMTITPNDNYPHYARKSRRLLRQHTRISHFLTDHTEVGWAH